jgi:pimeloyl-ACP methyl ester carboxylesterase
MSSTPYVPRLPTRSDFAELRGLRLHWHSWGDPSLVTSGRPPLVLLHGWMDVGASFQFLVDELDALGAAGRWIVAPDWRGFGLSAWSSSDTYWYPDYLADLDTLLDRLQPTGPVDLAGHSLGGNVAMLYAGARPARVRRLANLEGFGLPATQAADSPLRMLQWLDELKAPQTFKLYDSLDEVAQRLLNINPRLPAERAAWLALHWSSAESGPDGGTCYRLRADPAHKRVNPVLYRKDEVVETWRRIQAPVLWVEGDRTPMLERWHGRYPRAEFEERLAVVPSVQRALVANAAHMLHQEQPAALARALADFFDTEG